MNPFDEPSPLPFEAPAFDRIHDADYEPAIEEGMRAQLAEIDAIAGQADAPTFDNTIVAHGAQRRRCSAARRACSSR